MPRHPAIVSEEPFVPSGALASVVIDDGANDDEAESHGADVHADELSLTAMMTPQRRGAFLAGRRALRAALHQIAPHSAEHPLLQTGRGAPRLPIGWTGSISHKRTRAIAVAAPSSGGLVGVDLEERPTPRDLERPSLASRILTTAERDAIEGLDLAAHRESTVVRFAIKEAVYKAIDPYVGRYVRFTEVEVDVSEDGQAAVRLLLPEPEMRQVHVEARWRFEDRWIIAMARSVRR